MNPLTFCALLWAALTLTPAAAQTADASPPNDLISPSERPNAPGIVENEIFSNKPVDLHALKGRVVLLNFWATWCTPCLDEIPALNALQTVHPELRVLGVAVYSGDTATEEYAKKLKIGSPIIYGSYEMMADYGKVAAIPTTFLIDKSGRIAAKVVGARTQAEYEALVSRLLTE